MFTKAKKSNMFSEDESVSAKTLCILLTCLCEANLKVIHFPSAAKQN